MKHGTMNRLDTYAFWGAVAVLAGFLWWLFAKLG
jgi:hypothetical protein